MISDTGMSYGVLWVPGKDGAYKSVGVVSSTYRTAVIKATDALAMAFSDRYQVPVVYITVSENIECLEHVSEENKKIIEEILENHGVSRGIQSNLH